MFLARTCQPNLLLLGELCLVIFHLCSYPLRFVYLLHFIAISDNWFALKAFGAKDHDLNNWLQESWIYGTGFDRYLRRFIDCFYSSYRFVAIGHLSCSNPFCEWGSQQRWCHLLRPHVAEEHCLQSWGDLQAKERLFYQLWFYHEIFETILTHIAGTCSSSWSWCSWITNDTTMTHLHSRPSTFVNYLMRNCCSISSCPTHCWRWSWRGPWPS